MAKPDAKLRRAIATAEEMNGELFSSSSCGSGDYLQIATIIVLQAIADEDGELAEQVAEHFSAIQAALSEMPVAASALRQTPAWQKESKVGGNSIAKADMAKVKGALFGK